MEKAEVAIKRRTLGVLAIGLLMFSMVSFANASPIIYSDRSSWESATSGITTVDFEGIAPDNAYVSLGANSTIGGVTFTSNGGVYVIGQNYAEASGVFGMGSGAILFGYGSSFFTSGISASGFGDVTSFGIDLRGYAEDHSIFNIALSTGELFSLTVPNPAGGFFGVTSDDAFSSVQITTRNYISMDNFSFGDHAVSVPEPSSVLLFGTALAGLGIFRKKAKSTI